MDTINTILGIIASIASIYAAITGYQIKNKISNNKQTQKNILTNGNVNQSNNTK